MSNNINAATALCGLIGNPVGHSKSPLIHNSLSESLGINLAYVTFKVENGTVDTAIKGAYALNIKGLNVTVPHKCEVINSLVDIDPLAKCIGAVNTLVRVEGGYKGYNTDYIGLKRQLEEDGIKIKGEELIILGAGGASRAITFMCASEGASRVYLLNRSIDNARSLAADVNAYMGKEVVMPMLLSEYDKIEKGKYTVIQTTSKGLAPDVEGTPIEDEDFYDLVGYGVDIIFNPYETKFMKLSKAHGAKTQNGLGMLLYQGVAAYELWNDISVPPQLCREVYDLLRNDGK